ncbi:hypothetical protein NH340_JMT09286 [Sarcoptes scabiei]|nr:hypothetical protein NH340_JMT09286 [Sarcoptes scabiei]
MDPKSKHRINPSRHSMIYSIESDYFPMPINPYCVALKDFDIQSRTLSLPRGRNRQSNLKKITQKNSYDKLPLVNPAFFDGTIRPIAVSDYDDPLKLHQIAKQITDSDLIDIKTKSSSNTTECGRFLSNPSIRLTRNVSSTLSKIADSSIEYSSRSNDCVRSRFVDSNRFAIMEIPMRSFVNESKDDHLNNQSQRNSTASTASNPSSDVSGDQSTTSSLYYVDCRVDKSDNQSPSESLKSSTITGSIEENNLDQCKTKFNDTISNEIDVEDFPPPPDSLLHDNDDVDVDVDDGDSDELKIVSNPSNTIENVSEKHSKSIKHSSSSVTELLPPLPPSDYHSLSSLQRRKQQFNDIYCNKKKLSTEMPGYSTMALSSFACNRNETGRKHLSPPAPPPPPPLPFRIKTSNSVGSSSIQSSPISSPYAEPSSSNSFISSSSSPDDNIPLCGDESPTPLSHYEHPLSIDQNQTNPNCNDNKTTMFQRISSPTYGWVYHQPVASDPCVQSFETNHGDSFSLASTIPIHHSSKSEDLNNNDHHQTNKTGDNTMNYKLFQNFDVDKDDEDRERIKTRIMDRSYQTFFDSTDDGSGMNSSNLDFNSKQKRSSKSYSRAKRKHKFFTRCCRLLIIISSLLSLLILMLIVGASLYRHYVLSSSGTDPFGIDSMNNFFSNNQKAKLNSSNDDFVRRHNSTNLHQSTSISPSMLATTIKLLMSTTLNASSTTNVPYSTTVAVPEIPMATTTTITEADSPSELPTTRYKSLADTVTTKPNIIVGNLDETTSPASDNQFTTTSKSSSSAPSTTKQSIRVPSLHGNVSSEFPPTTITTTTYTTSTIKMNSPSESDKNLAEFKTKSIAKIDAIPSTTPMSMNVNEITTIGPITELTTVAPVTDSNLEGFIVSLPITDTFNSVTAVTDLEKETTTASPKRRV